MRFNGDHSVVVPFHRGIISNNTFVLYTSFKYFGKEAIPYFDPAITNQKNEKMKTFLRFFIVISLLYLPRITFSMVYTVYENGLSDHSDPNNVLSLQYHINNAQSGDKIILGSNKSYRIKNRILLKNSRILLGKRCTAGFEYQNIIADQNFPQDLEMILVFSGTQNSPTTVKCVRFKGNNKAWRIARTTNGGHYYLFDRCRMEDTKNDFTQSDVNYVSSILQGKRFYDVSLIYCRGSDHVTINKCDLYNAGLNQYTGKVNPYNWKGFGSGIRFQYCDNVIVKSSRIERTLTEGIRLSGCRQVLIDNNTIVRTAMNNEWMDTGNNNKGIVASAITGYHNQGANKYHYGGQNICSEDGFNFSWVISNNRFYWNYNNAISVSGRSIKIVGNRSNYAYQNALYLGDWRSCSNGEGSGTGSAVYGNECTRNIQVNNNNFENSYYNHNNWSWVFNNPNDLSKSTAAPPRDIRIDGYDGSVNVYSNVNSSIWWDPDNSCACTCNLNNRNSDYTQNLSTSPKSKVSKIGLESISDVVIYPNPASDKITVVGRELNFNEIVVVDLKGKMILTTQQNTINVSDFSTGIYFIKLIVDEKVITKKFIKH